MESIKGEKPWYKKKRYIFPLIILGLIILSGSDNNSVSNVKSETITPVSSYSVQPYTATPIQKAVDNTNNNLSNNNYYNNVNGNTVHSPAYSNSVPSGASARCGDGTYSFSQSRRGTCSHHGGVSEWL